MAKDKYHDLVKNALIEEGWTVTDDPLTLKILAHHVDLEMEGVLAAQKGTEKIAVEIKNFIGSSILQDLYLAIGQFKYYRLALQREQPKRHLFLAIPDYIYNELKQDHIFMGIKAEAMINIITYNLIEQNIIAWHKQNDNK